MTLRYSKTLLRKLRNDIPIDRLIVDVLKLQNKVSEGYLRFLCPACGEFTTAVNPKTNLARCFSCQKNYNPIDMVMAAKIYSFTQAADYLIAVTNLK